ncbi:hypothetical protein DPMN_088726 [Dreissena polymorpha]|uniref:Uncharacterized protein n=1 Tax=Dreissena polymorpha TaxID=45954 RepID=A0A9D4KUL5_DREPO|nr:hypothetical protein DPMN_088726 [Dreissena polymorpha]
MRLAEGLKGSIALKYTSQRRASREHLQKKFVIVYDRKQVEQWINKREKNLVGHFLMKCQFRREELVLRDKPSARASPKDVIGNEIQLEKLFEIVDVQTENHKSPPVKPVGNNKLRDSAEEDIGRDVPAE